MIRTGKSTAICGPLGEKHCYMLRTTSCNTSYSYRRLSLSQTAKFSLKTWGNLIKKRKLPANCWPAGKGGGVVACLKFCKAVGPGTSQTDPRGIFPFSEAPNKLTATVTTLGFGPVCAWFESRSLYRQSLAGIFVVLLGNSNARIAP
jgi:hypothetical protein